MVSVTAFSLSDTIKKTAHRQLFRIILIIKQQHG